MKVLQINAVNGLSSTGRTTIELDNYLNENGHIGIVATSAGVVQSKDYKIGTAFEKKVHALFSRLFGLQGYYSKKGTAKLIEFIQEIKPDIVHLRNLHANYINLKMLFNYLGDNDIPTVITLHDCWLYTGKCTHYTVDNCNKWKTSCKSCPRLKKDNVSWFLDRTKKMHIDKKDWFKNIPRLAVVGVSDWITDEAKKSLLSSAKIIERVYNWIDLETFKPLSSYKIRKELNIESKYIILGVASSWSNEKGLDQFINLANQMDDSIIIILIGKIQSDIQLPEKVINIKETHDTKELVKYYCVSDVFINLSFEESFGKVTAEALACGTPVIVVNSTANPELVGENCGIKLNKNYAIEDLKDAISTMKYNGKDYYSKYCINHAQLNFSKKDRIADYIKIYEIISQSMGD